MFKRFITPKPINTVPSDKDLLTLLASHFIWFLVYFVGNKAISNAFEYKYPSSW